MFPKGYKKWLRIGAILLLLAIFMFPILEDPQHWVKPPKPPVQEELEISYPAPYDAYPAPYPYPAPFDAYPPPWVGYPAPTFPTPTLGAPSLPSPTILPTLPPPPTPAPY